MELYYLQKRLSDWIVFLKKAIRGLLFFILIFSILLTENNVIYKFCRWRDSNCRPLVWAATALPTQPRGGGPRPLKVCSKSLFPIKVRGNFGKGNLDFYQNSLLGKLRWREEREIFEKTYAQCDLIGWFIGIWATFQSLWQQWFCPNLPHY